MALQTILRPDQVSAVTELGDVIAKNAELSLKTPELRRIFGETLTGRILILDVAEVRQGTLVTWLG